MEKEHTVRQYDLELQEIRSRILEMGNQVQDMISRAMAALLDRRSDLAHNVIEFDEMINDLEIEIDEKSVTLIARWQPISRDLRLIIVALKIVTDLERMGDQCVSIAKRVLDLNEDPPLKPYIDLPRMAEWASQMVKESLAAFLQQQEDLALKVCRDDQVVDDLNVQLQRELLTYMMEDPQTIGRALNLMYVSKCLERIADHATNIAEMVIFLLKGEDIRHKKESDFNP
jgi:phosphate transport system protein